MITQQKPIWHDLLLQPDPYVKSPNQFENTSYKQHVNIHIFKSELKIYEWQAWVDLKKNIKIYTNMRVQAIWAANLYIAARPSDIFWIYFLEISIIFPSSPEPSRLPPPTHRHTCETFRNLPEPATYPYATTFETFRDHPQS